MPFPFMVKRVSSLCTRHRALHCAAFARGYWYREDVHGYKESANVTTRDTNNAFSRKEIDPNLQGVARLIEQYERYGHKIGKVNPLNLPRVPEIESDALLEPSLYGLELNQEFILDGETKTVEALVAELKAKFCGTITLETDTIESAEERDWVVNRFSQLQSQDASDSEKHRIAEILIKSQALDQYLAIKFPTLKRYGGEGAESLLVFVDQYLRSTSQSGVDEVMIGMPHRGRNNVLVSLLNFPIEVMLRKIKGLSEFPDEALSIATGDVLSHLSVSNDFEYEDGRKLHVNLIPNPSHLEAQVPVAIGKCRGRQQTLRDGDFSDGEATRGSKATCLLLHGDASFTGQGGLVVEVQLLITYAQETTLLQSLSN